MLAKASVPPDVHHDNYWTARLMEGTYEEQGLNAALSSVLDKLAANKSFLVETASGGGKLELFIGWFFDEGNSGAVLDHSLLRRLSEFNIDISFDVYPHNPAG